jgi:hypothetical protein
MRLCALLDRFTAGRRSREGSVVNGTHNTYCMDFVVERYVNKIVEKKVVAFHSPGTNSPISARYCILKLVDVRPAQVFRV